MDRDELRAMRKAEGYEIYDKIQSTLRKGGIVTMTTYTRQWVYDKPQHIDLFKVGSDGLYSRHGKRWDYAQGAAFRFYAPKEAHA